MVDDTKNIRMLLTTHNTLKTAFALNPYNKEIYYLISEINKNIKRFNEAKLFNDIYELFIGANI